MTTTPKGTHMPTDPNRALLRAVEKLTTQVRRIADTLETPVTDGADAGQTTGEGTVNPTGRPLSEIEHWAPVCGPSKHLAHATGTCGEAEGFTDDVLNWVARLAIPDMRHVTATMRNNEQLRAGLDRVRSALDDRPALCTDSVYERGWNDAAEMVRHALAGPTTEG
ncbi:hypothetical protein [Streptomyces griseus]|uniref:hypothetical protein n=1 Tax=Streptomyces griseus TaxID=1911 RepID=UPI0033B9AE31